VPPIKYGGTERVIFHLIKGLKEEGHEPILLGPGDSKVDCEVIPITNKHIFFPRTIKSLPNFNKRIKAVNKKTDKLLRDLLPRVDIVHSHAFDLINFQDFPNLTTIHGPISFNEFPYYLARKHLNYVSISKNQQAAFPELNWRGVVYNGEDPENFPLNIKPQNYVCFVGRFDREKTPHLAIQLAINLGIKIKLAGKIDFLGNEYYRNEIRKYVRHPLVDILGELTAKETARLVCRAKCNLHPTGFREPFGLTVLEAAYCGTPTLAIERGSMPELIEEGRTGMLVEDFVEGYHQIEDCFNMNREYISKRARRLFNYKRMTRDYLKIYREVIKNTK